MAPAIEAIKESYFSSLQRNAGGNCTSQPTQISPLLERMIPSPPFITGKLSLISICSIPSTEPK